MRERRHISAIEAACRATGLGVIVDNRDNAVVNDETLARPCERNPNLIGFKDGVDNIELMTRIIARMSDQLIYRRPANRRGWQRPISRWP